MTCLAVQGRELRGMMSPFIIFDILQLVEDNPKMSPFVWINCFTKSDVDSVWNRGSIFWPGSFHAFSVVSAQPNNYKKLSLPWPSQRSEMKWGFTVENKTSSKNQWIVWDLRDLTAMKWPVLGSNVLCWQNMNGTIDIHEFVMFFRTNVAWVSLGQWLQLSCVLEACELVVRAIPGQWNINRVSN